MLAALLGLYGLQLANGLELGSSPRNLGLISNEDGTRPGTAGRSSRKPE